MRRKTLVIIGNGMAATRLLEELVQRNARERYDVIVYGEEPGAGYNRILLGKVLAGAAPESIAMRSREWYRDNGIGLESGVCVRRLDTDTKFVETGDGQRQRYDVAVIATGSQPLLPPIEGIMTTDGALRTGVFVYRTIADAAGMRARARAGDSAVVLGGGLLGLEAAKGLADLGLHVTIVHASRVLLNAQVDELGGELLERQVERCGMFVRTGRTIEAVLGDEHVDGVRLDDGRRLAADMVVVACGVRPRIDVARASGLPINKAILVNDTLATEVPGVYAIGECVEHSGKTYGLVAPAWEQAAVLADVLTGANPQARYRGSKLYSRLKVAGVDVASMGRIEPEFESDEVIQVVETRRGVYRKLIVRGGELVGAVLVGNTDAAARLVQLFDRGDPLPSEPLLALCTESLARGTTSAARVVCNCRKVTEAHLSKAIDDGACTMEALCAATGATTGCGSCQSEVSAILGRQVPPTRKLSVVG